MTDSTPGLTTKFVRFCDLPQFFYTGTRLYISKDILTSDVFYRGAIHFLGTPVSGVWGLCNNKPVLEDYRYMSCSKEEAYSIMRVLSGFAVNPTVNEDLIMIMTLDV